MLARNQQKIVHLITQAIQKKILYNMWFLSGQRLLSAI